VAASYLLLWVYLAAGAAGEMVGSVIRAPAETSVGVQSKQSGSAIAIQAAQRVFGSSGRPKKCGSGMAAIGNV
jgi:hypothetical protein